MTGFYEHSPTNARLIVAAGMSNDGTGFRQEPLVFGQEWGQMINEVVDWLEIQPNYETKVGVVGAIDSELAWNTGAKSLDWKQGYTNYSPRPYIYFGSCEGCPSYNYPNWIINGWSLEQVYQMASETNAMPMPQIYARSGINAAQWYYLSLYRYLHASDHQPIAFLGTLTQYSACHEIEPDDDCNLGTYDALDNLPDQGYSQLFDAIWGDPRTRRGSNNIDFELPASSDMSWNIEKVSLP